MLVEPNGQMDRCRIDVRDREDQTLSLLDVLFPATESSRAIGNLAMSHGFHAGSASFAHKYRHSRTVAVGARNALSTRHLPLQR